MKDKIIIYQPWGGLGDNLAHTVIPRLCKTNNIECLLSKEIACRNKEIYDFVWKDNPDITGRTDEIDMTWCDNRPYEARRKDYNEIQAIQKTHGFEPITEYPHIHYTPNKVDKFEGKTVIDISGFSLGKRSHPSLIKDAIASLGLKVNDTIELSHSQVQYGKAYPVCIDFHNEDVNDFFTYSNILYSCKRYITLNNGPATLASAIKNKMNTDCDINILTPPEYMPGVREGGYTYSNTNYIQLG